MEMPGNTLYSIEKGDVSAEKKLVHIADEE